MQRVARFGLMLSGILVVGATPSAAVESKPAPVAIREWWILGPTPDPLPAFGEEQLGKFGANEALALDRFDVFSLWPQADGSWNTRRSNDAGVVSLDAPAPAIVWLATTLDADRFVSCELTLLGTHPRRAWLDGVAIASGSGADVKATLKLFPGTHRVLVQAVRDAATSGAWTIGATLSRKELPLDGVTIGTALPRRLDLLDTLLVPKIVELAVSPDGRSYAAVWSRVMAGSDESESWVELRRTDDNTLLRTLRGTPAPGQIAFDPSGRWFSFVSLDAAGRATLWISDGAETRAVLERVEKLAMYRWLPDGSGVIYSLNETPEADKRGVKRVEGLLDRQTGHRTRGSLYLAALTGVRRRLTAGAVSASLYDVAPDGSRLLFVREFDDYTARPFIRRELWEMDLGSSVAKKLLDLRFAQSVQYDPHGRKLLVLSSPAEFGDLGLEALPGGIANDYEGELYLWDPASAKAECLTRAFSPSVEQVAWNRAAGTLVLRATDRDYRRLFTLDPVSGRATTLDSGADNVEQWAIAWHAPEVVVSATGPWVPGVLGGLELTHGTRRSFVHPAAESLKATAKGTVESWSFQTGNGRTIDGRVYLPPGFDPAQRYPMIVNYYAGVFPVNREFGGRYPKEWWASLGYVVYVPQPSGAVGYGNAFASLHVGEWGKLVVDEVIEGTNRFLAAHPYVDPKRVGAIGASYGGFTTMALLTKTEMFAAAVSHAGISSIGGYWGEGYWGYNYNAVSAANSFPWNDKAIYVDRSPLFHADKIKTPLLLTHGSADTNVPVGESDGLYTALMLLGAPVEYLQVEGEDHWIITQPKRLVWARSIVAWFDRWLKQQPQGWEELYPSRG